MSKLIFMYGTMKSGKSADLIKTFYNYKIKGENVLVLKPSIDTRDLGKIKTRLGAEIDCELINDDDNVFAYQIADLVEKLESKESNIKAILIDEAQFLSSEKIVCLSSFADTTNIPVIFYGLKTDFKGCLFEGSATILELADKIQEVKTVCQFCDRKAIMNLRYTNGKPADLNEEQISIGDDEYHQVCRKHWFEAYQ